MEIKGAPPKDLVDVSITCDGLELFKKEDFLRRGRYSEDSDKLKRQKESA